MSQANEKTHLNSLVRYLQDNGLEKTCKEFNINATRHLQYSNLVLLKYTIDSDMSHWLPQMCRGIIVDEHHNFKIVSLGFTKFFNHGEKNAAPLDMNTVRFYEKLDGSIITLYWYDSHWNVQTSGMPDAHGQVGNNNVSFEDLFWKTFAKQGCHTFYLKTDYCYTFELCTSLNEIVVAHPEDRIVLTGIRNMDTLLEEKIDTFLKFNELPNCSIPDTFCPLDGSISSLNELLSNFSPRKVEGAVAVDAFFNRQKIKKPDYVQLHHVKSTFSDKIAIEIIQKEESEELISYFPRHKERMDFLYACYVSLGMQMNKAYHDILNSMKEKGLNPNDQKGFASQVVGNSFSSFIFARHKGKVDSAIDFLRKLRPEQVLSMLGLDKEKDQ